MRRNNKTELLDTVKYHYCRLFFIYSYWDNTAERCFNLER